MVKTRFALLAFAALALASCEPVFAQTGQRLDQLPSRGAVQYGKAADGTFVPLAVNNDGTQSDPGVAAAACVVACPVQGPAATGADTAGNPVLMGCDTQSTLPTNTVSKVAPLRCDTRNGLFVVIKSAAASSAASVQAPQDGLSGQAALMVMTQPLGFNGTSFDRVPQCSFTQTVSAAAGSATQVVAQGGSASTRVCFYRFSISANGTWKWVYGTGTNCATGKTDLTSAVSLNTGVPDTAGTGMSYVLTVPASNALCIEPTGGNITGWLTRAQW